jgi:hypothetical protein
MLRTVYTPDSRHINVAIPEKYIGMELEVLVFPTNEILTCKSERKNPNETHNMLSISMQQALDDERKGRITKLFNHKNAVAEILE